MVSPDGENGAEILSDLWNEGPCIEAPSVKFKPTLSESASRQLRTQLHLTLADLREALDDRDYDHVVKRCTELDTLAIFFTPGIR